MSNWRQEKLKSIQLKKYSKTTITQLGTCTVEIEHKNKNKLCKFSVVLGNGQALLGMADIDTLDIININIHSIGTEHGGGKVNCCTNKAAAQSMDTTQETNRSEKCYIHKDCISKSDNTDKSQINNKLANAIGYFLPGPNCDSDKRMNAEITQQLQKDFEDVFNGIGCFDGTFSLQLKPGSKPY